MEITHHPLPLGSNNCQYTLSSFHYGPPGAKKAYLQASLHADELPGMLLLQHLRPMLEKAEGLGLLRGEIVLVPVANPIGLGQTFMGDQMGRFDFATGGNFNRNFPALSDKLIALLADKLTDDIQQNRRLIRAGMLQLLQTLALNEKNTPFEAMRIILSKLAHDADIVLDLHCDCEAVMHIYVPTQRLDDAELLGRYLGARAILSSDASGGACFDEMLYRPWLELHRQFGADYPIPQPCFSATVELRGEQDVFNPLASADAQAIYHYLCRAGMIADEAAATPPALCAPTPLAGSMTAYATAPGIVSYVAGPGDVLNTGDVICDIIDPLTGQSYALTSPVDGVMYAREIFRYARRGMALAKIAGKVAQRTGDLLSP